MKTGLLALFLLITTSVAALAQTDTLALTTTSRRIRLAKVTFRTLDGGRINGVLYALTDSGAVYFADTKAAIEAFRNGQLPALDTLGARQIDRIAVKREGRFGRSIAIGTGLGLIALLTANASSNPYAQLFASVFVFPLGILIGTGVGLFPRMYLQPNGKLSEFVRKRRSLNRYTVETQRQRLRTEPVW